MATGLKRFNNYSPKAKHRAFVNKINHPPARHQLSKYPPPSTTTTTSTKSTTSTAASTPTRECNMKQSTQLVNSSNNKNSINCNNICNMIPLAPFTTRSSLLVLLTLSAIHIINGSSVAPSHIQPPQVIDNPGRNEIVVGAGSNVSLICKARGGQPLNFVWFQDERNLTTDRANSEPQSTKLLEEKRYEIGEEPGSPEEPDVTTSILHLYNLKITDTSLFLCWVENSANYSLLNYSLIVDDSAPVSLIGSPVASSGFLGSLIAGETQIGLVSIGFVSLLLATVILLLIIKHKTNIGSSKNPQSGADFKKPKSKYDISGPIAGSATHRNLVTMGGAPLASMGSIVGSQKFGNMSNENGRISTNYAGNRGSMLNDSDQDGADDDDDDCSVSDESSVSSYKKSNKIIASGELDGFIEHMRSGIINMDYHSMSPAIQFNTNTLKKSDQKHHQQPPSSQHHHQQQQQQSIPQQTQLPPYSHQFQHQLHHQLSQSQSNHQLPNHQMQQHQHLQHHLHNQQQQQLQAQLQMQQVYKPVAQMTNVPIGVGYPPAQGQISAALQQMSMMHHPPSHQQFYQHHTINVNLPGVGGGGHFPSASNASSAPYYGGPVNGSMATTTSDLSPGGSSAIMSINKQMNCL